MEDVACCFYVVLFVMHKVGVYLPISTTLPIDRKTSWIDEYTDKLVNGWFEAQIRLDRVSIYN